MVGLRLDFFPIIDIETRIWLQIIVIKKVIQERTKQGIEKWTKEGKEINTECIKVHFTVVVD